MTWYLIHLAVYTHVCILFKFAKSEEEKEREKNCLKKIMKIVHVYTEALKDGV